MASHAQPLSMDVEQQQGAGRGAPRSPCRAFGAGILVGALLCAGLVKVTSHHGDADHDDADHGDADHGDADHPRDATKFAGAFLPPTPFGSASGPGQLARATRPGRAAARSRVAPRMVDWDWDKKAAEEEYDGPGAERGQVNRADEVAARTAERLERARQEAAEAGRGSMSGLGRETGVEEGGRDPTTGRLVLDPLKIPTKDQGAPGTWEEYLKMRQAKEGGVAKDAAGNVIDGVKPSYAVQAGTWGPPKEALKEDLDDIFGKKPVSAPVMEVDAGVQAQRDERAAEQAKRDEEAEARMAKWMADAAAKKASGR